MKWLSAAVLLTVTSISSSSPVSNAFPRNAANDTTSLALARTLPDSLEPNAPAPAPWRLDTDDGAWSGFARRCAVPLVGCLTEQQLAAYPAASVGDRLVHSNTLGVKRTCSGAGARSRCELLVRQCAPYFWIDGAPYAEHLWQVEQWYGTLQFKGIEIYGAENTPLRYRHTSKRCAVVLWTN